MRPTDAAKRWSDTWQRSWEALDAAAIVALYAADAVIYTEPFREPSLGPERVRSYLNLVFAEEELPQVVMGTPIVEGDRGAVPWWASLHENGTEVTLAGTSVLRFDADGLVLEQWDTWNEAKNRRLPPAGLRAFADR